MELSSTFCRLQETVQRERAAGATLENIRLIAEKAAKAWNSVALIAEQREARRHRIRVTAEAAAVEQRQATSEHDALFSENPDRGFDAV